MSVPVEEDKIIYAALPGRYLDAILEAVDADFKRHLDIERIADRKGATETAEFHSDAADTLLRAVIALGLDVHDRWQELSKRLHQ